jgi:predicted amidophosphoribosyltransferase
MMMKTGGVSQVRQVIQQDAPASICVKCNKSYPDLLPSCPHCGAPNPNYPKRVTN